MEVNIPFLSQFNFKRFRTSFLSGGFSGNLNDSNPYTVGTPCLDCADNSGWCNSEYDMCGKVTLFTSFRHHSKSEKFIVTSPSKGHYSHWQYILVVSFISESRPFTGKT